MSDAWSDGLASSVSGEPSDSELMRRFRENWDEDSFHRLVQRYYRPAVGVAEARLRDAGLAQDAVQEALLRVVREKARFDATRPFAPWFYTILRHVCIDLYRRASKYQEKLNELALQTELPGRNEGSAEACAGVVDLLEKLPPADREILILRLRDGLPFHEIAELVGCSTEAAKKRAQRALRKIRSGVCR